MAFFEFRDEVASELESDWLAFDQVAYLARQTSCAGASDLFKCAVDAIESLILEKVIVPGSLGKTGFSPWGGKSDQWMARIRADVEKFSSLDEVKTGDICWFDLSPS